MTEYDPHGELLARRRQRNRRHNYHTALMCIGTFCALIFIACLAVIL